MILGEQLMTRPAVKFDFFGSFYHEMLELLPECIFVHEIVPHLTIVSRIQLTRCCKYYWNFRNTIPFTEAKFWNRLVKQGRTNDGLALAIDKGYFDLVPYFEKIATDFLYAFGSAAKLGDLDMVKYYFNKLKSDTIAKALKYGSFQAAKRNHKHIIDFLRTQGKAGGLDAVGSAARNGHLELLKELLEEPYLNRQRCYALANGLAGGHKHVVEWIMDPPPEWFIELRNYFALAASGGNMDVMNLMLEGKYDFVHAWDAGLCAAVCTNNNKEFIKFFLDNGANPEEIKRGKKWRKREMLFMWHNYRIVVHKANPKKFPDINTNESLLCAFCINKLQLLKEEIENQVWPPECICMNAGECTCGQKVSMK